MLFGSVEKPPRLSEFEMEIPNDLIAQNPTDKRDHAKLMVLHRKDQAIEQIIEILDIALMIRYQDTDEFENVLRELENGDQVVDIFKNQIELIYF